MISCCSPPLELGRFSENFFGDGNLLQIPCAHSHQQLDPNRTASVYHALLNVTALLGEKALPLDDSACEILAAALQVHFFCMMVQDLADWGVIKVDQNAVFCEWLKDNPTPPEFVGTSVGPKFWCQIQRGDRTEFCEKKKI